MIPWAQTVSGISTDSTISAGLTTVTVRQTDRQTDRPTDRPCYSVCNNRPHLASATTRPNNMHYHVVALQMTISDSWRSFQVHEITPGQYPK